MSSTNESVATLYSFRRCPYAMRARMSILLNGITVELREIILKDKPPQMLLSSPKGTVPVLVLPNGQVIDESDAIMSWARDNSDNAAFDAPSDEQLALISDNDSWFKAALDRYKYHDRHPEQSQSYYREQGELFLQQLEQQLITQDYLFGTQQSYADIAIFPFVRQFAYVDKTWFEQAPYPALHRWLAVFIQSDSFEQAMIKHPPWQVNDATTYFPN